MIRSKSALQGASLVLFLCSQAGHADCLDIIAASKLVSDTVHEESQVASYARAFCNEYSSVSADKRSAEFGVAYSVLSASFGQASASESRVASRYCDASQQASAKADAFREYVETIAPGAYSAFIRCEELRGSGISISVDMRATLPKYMAVAVSFSSTDALASQVIDHTASPGVKCRWNNASGSRTTIKANSSDVLSCTRASSLERSAVHVVATSKPNSELSFAWDRYENELPVDTLKQLSKQVALATSELTELSRSFDSSVVAFAQPTCPPGWLEYKPAFGRFIRGIDKGQPKTDPDGLRSEGSLQPDSFLRHTHTRPKDVFDAGGTRPNEGAACGTCQGYGYSNPPPTGDASDNGGGDETRPKNVALLFCTPTKG
ncbi:MAG: hypothetical protein ABI689_07785 [Thermoanaerobaculia bacterium]